MNVTLNIECAHWPWLVKHANRLGYFGPIDYLNGILGMALVWEMSTNGEELPWDEGSDADPDPYGDGIPF